ncbi:hypothetical protein PSV09DRAFT_2377703 [Bipolaris maydis]|nr:hypothetical protein J3E74DRAFT_433312 [Bipolaris maydis]KAJ5052530.1 hypothetical protein J3E74DRAFT_433075 [Bipolaris maydis]KAJ6203677.1 hypothetical protein PSV09DRAFT_2377703 [Bipolaris maydis]
MYTNHEQAEVRYVRGLLLLDQLRWDVSSVLRLVCQTWHDWALDYALREVFLKNWGSVEFPRFGSAIRRVCVHGFYTAETVSLVYETLKECDNLTSLSCPWTTIRYLIHDSWQVLPTGRRVRLESLELQCVEPTTQQLADPTNWIDLNLLFSVDFGYLHRLKIFGNTTFMPVTDSDVAGIASTATRLKEFHLTCNSSATIDSVVAMAEAAPATLRIIEHSLRSQDGFWHSHPGSPNSSGQHYCAVFRKLSRSQTLSVSLPSICADFFTSGFCEISGILQVRAVHICEHANSRWTLNTMEALRVLLDRARLLIKHCSCYKRQDSLYIEFFFAGYIFEPGLHKVLGDFSRLQKLSKDSWSPATVFSSKGPYGSTGLYDGNEGVSFERIEEEDFVPADRWLYVL